MTVNALRRIANLERWNKNRVYVQVEVNGKRYDVTGKTKDKDVLVLVVDEKD